MSTPKPITAKEAIELQTKIVTLHGRLRNPFANQTLSIDRTNLTVPPSSTPKLDLEISQLVDTKLENTKFQKLSPSVKKIAYHVIGFHLKKIALDDHAIISAPKGWIVPEDATGKALAFSMYVGMTVELAGIAFELNGQPTPLSSIGFGIAFISMLGLAWQGRKLGKQAAREIEKYVKDNPLMRQMNHALHEIVGWMDPFRYQN